MLKYRIKLKKLVYVSIVWVHTLATNVRVKQDAVNVMVNIMFYYVSLTLGNELVKLPLRHKLMQPSQSHH